jgi:VanZ family protein
MAFMPPLQRRSGSGSAFLRVAEAMLIYLAMLELGQYFAPGRHAAVADLLLNACGIAAALIAAVPFFLKAPAKVRSA